MPFGDWMSRVGRTRRSGPRDIRFIDHLKNTLSGSHQEGGCATSSHGLQAVLGPSRGGVSRHGEAIKCPTQRRPVHHRPRTGRRGGVGPAHVHAVLGGAPSRVDAWQKRRGLPTQWRRLPAWRNWGSIFPNQPGWRHHVPRTGSLVGYPILDLDQFFTDIHKYLRFLEEAVILTCAEYGVWQANRGTDRRVDRP